MTAPASRYAAYADDAALAVNLAREAGVQLMALRQAALTDEMSSVPRQKLGARGDALAQQFLSRSLAEARPDDAVLSEEAANDLTRLTAKRVWIIDPLDGTREYAEGDLTRTDWAVHVALVVAGEPVAAVVALPALGLVFDTLSPHAACPVTPVSAPMRIVVSRSRASALAHSVAARVGAELIPHGSAGAKAMAVVQGHADAYLHAGGLSQWDSCAPVGVALAAGLHASRIDGSPCVYNSADVSIPDLLICRVELAEPLLTAIRDATRDTKVPA